MVQESSRGVTPRTWGSALSPQLSRGPRFSSLESGQDRAGQGGTLGVTFDGLQDDSGVVVGDDVGIAVLGLVHLQVGMFPRKLLAWVDGLQGRVEAQSGRGVRRGGAWGRRAE